MFALLTTLFVTLPPPDLSVEVCADIREELFRAVEMGLLSSFEASELSDRVCEE